LAAAQPELVKGLVGSLERLPPGIRLGLSARGRFPAPLGRLQTRGMAAVLGPEALRFDEQEEAAFLANRALDAATRARVARMEGWPLGVDLTSALLSDRPLTTAGGELAGYLAEEVLAALPPERQALLMRAAWLEAPAAPALAAVFGIQDAAAQLEALEADQLVHRLADGEGFRLPAYLRDHLLAVLERQTDAATRTAWHRAAARYYQDPGHGQDGRERALPHLIGAGEEAEAAQACQALFPGMLARGRAAEVARRLADLGAAAEARQPILGYWRGQLLGRAGQAADATAAYERALKGFQAMGDQAGEVRALGRLATIAGYAGEPRKAGSLLVRALGLLDAAGPAERADVHLTRAMIAEQRGDLALMRECNEAVLALSVGDDVDVAICHGLAHQNLCTWALHRGDLALAEAHARQAEALAGEWAFYPARLMAGYLQAHLRLLGGDLEAAGAFMRQRPERWEDLLDWHDLGVAWTIVGQYHHAKGDWADAERALERSRATFRAAGFPEGTKLPVERLLWLAAERKQFARAAGLYEVAAGDAPTLFDHALVLPRAWSLHLEGRSAEAEALLAPALAELVALEAWLPAGRGMYVQAAIAAAGPHGPAALEAADAFASTHGLDFLRAEPVARLDALRARPAPHPSASPQGSGATSAPTATAAAKATGSTASTSTAAAPSPGQPGAARLVVNLFGDLAATLDGVRLDAWPRRKAKLLLAALALYPRGLGVVELVELLADADAGPSGLGIVQANASALRKALGGAKAVAFQDERYWLDASLGLACDVQAFERGVAEGLRRRDADPAAAAAQLTEALSLYTGNLLDEPFFEPYFHAERTHLQQQALAALAWLASWRQGLGDFSGAEAELTRAGRLAPTDEDAHLRLMAFFAERGNAERVRHAYWDYRKALKTRLGATPDEAFEAAYRQALAKAG
jgi:DNA-binding SARP family transcriptional activator